MIIPEEHIDDFIRRWENAFNETLSREDARIKAIELLELYKMLSRRQPADDRGASPAMESQVPGL